MQVQNVQASWPSAIVFAVHSSAHLWLWLHNGLPSSPLDLSCQCGASVLSSHSPHPVSQTTPITIQVLSIGCLLIKSTEFITFYFM